MRRRVRDAETDRDLIEERERRIRCSPLRREVCPDRKDDLVPTGPKIVAREQRRVCAALSVRLRRCQQRPAPRSGE